MAFEPERQEKEPHAQQRLFLSEVRAAIGAVKAALVPAYSGLSALEKPLRRRSVRYLYPAFISVAPLLTQQSNRTTISKRVSALQGETMKAANRLSSASPTAAVEPLDFTSLKLAVAAQFELMRPYTLYRVDLSSGQGSPEQRAAATGDLLWEAYLASFPGGSNPIYRERTEHDCQCCRHFIRTMGAVVALINGEVVSLWDTFAEIGAYGDVCVALSNLIHTGAIDNIFLYPEKTVGADRSFAEVVNEAEASSTVSTKVWEHFHLHLPATAVVDKAAIGPRLSEARSTYDVALRGLRGITMDSIDTVLELIAQKSLYRGEEHLRVLNAFRKLKAEFDSLGIDERKQKLLALIENKKDESLKQASIEELQEMVGAL